MCRSAAGGGDSAGRRAWGQAAGGLCSGCGSRRGGGEPEVAGAVEGRVAGVHGAERVCAAGGVAGAGAVREAHGGGDGGRTERGTSATAAGEPAAGASAEPGRAAVVVRPAAVVVSGADGAWECGVQHTAGVAAERRAGSGSAEE